MRHHPHSASPRPASQRPGDAGNPASLAASRASWVEVDAGAVRHNLRLIRALAGSARVYAVCKGDAYGFEVGLIARLAADEQVDALACGDPDDVRQVRAAGVTLPILLYASTAASDLHVLGTPDVVVTAHDVATLQTCLAHDLAFSLKLDSGFHRLGFREQDLGPVLAAAARHPHARVHGVYTHLTGAESPSAVAEQVTRFAAMADRIDAAGWKGLERMVASSRILLAAPHLALDAVNPGRLVYGLLEPPWDRQADTRSALAAVKASIIALKRVAAGAATGYGEGAATRDTVLAVIPFGFIDGYPRHPAGGAALVRGQRVALVGQRHTEHSLLDVTDVAGVALGDEVVLLGAQGDERITMHELAVATGVAQIELVPRLARNPRRRIL